jgi:DNA-binding response OmpR family regulator
VKDEALANNGSLEGKRILVIEDDPSISLGLRMNLEAEGYSVQVADDGEAGLECARLKDMDLIVLDIMLPKLNGFEVLRLIRAEDLTTPIIVLSARDTELDVVMGLEFGAEDYVTKPFSLAELLARVKAVLRRNAVARRALAAAAPQAVAVAAPATDAASSEVIQIGALSIDARTRQVNRAGTQVTLTATEFDVLWCLAQGGGRVLSREEIQAVVWGPKHHGTRRTIDNFMMQLRTKLERDPSEPDYLLTVRGVGYRLKF